ncbi:MAG: RloB domain-containing protein [Nocardiopsaceae bacterium]|nr:RloB domain-containing protein [Nocardiopsaceae bacterium]
MSPRDERRGGARVRGAQARRSAASIPERRVVFVVAEGERTEREYLGRIDGKYGRRHGFHLRFPEGTHGRKPSEVVDDAEKLADDDVETWAFFDRDQHPGIPQAMAAARKAGIRVAFSHPAFELWLLLHFQQFAAPQGGDNARATRELRRKPGFEDYDRSQRDGKGITADRFDALTADGGIARAVRNARRLDDDCPSGCCSGRDPKEEGHPPGRCDPIRRDPSTGVWRLIEGLGITDTRSQKG